MGWRRGSWWLTVAVSCALTVACGGGGPTVAREAAGAASRTSTAIDDGGAPTASGTTGSGGSVVPPAAPDVARSTPSGSDAVPSGTTDRTVALGPGPGPTEISGVTPGADLSVPPTTVAPTTVAAPSQTTDVTEAEPAVGSLETVRADVLSRISYPWRSRLSAWTIEFLPARPGYLGATWTATKRIEIYVRDGQTIDELAFTLAHEMGHAVDLTYLDGAGRDRWLAARGASGTQWWAGSGASDYAVGAGDWAESFAVWQVGGQSLSTVAGQPTPEQLELLGSLASR